MSEQNWTKEPWIIVGSIIGARSKNAGQGFDAVKVIASVSIESSTHDADIGRIVACVNALAGRDPGCVEKMEEQNRTLGLLCTELLSGYKQLSEYYGSHSTLERIAEIETALSAARRKE